MKKTLLELQRELDDTENIIRACDTAQVYGLTFDSASFDKYNEAIAAHVIGDVEGKVCLMFDDIIDTAGTITEAAKLLKSKGAKAVYVGAAHAVFSGPALDRIKNSPIEQCIVSNTIPWNQEDLPSNIKILSVAPLLGQAISRIHDDESVSSLFGFEKEMKV